MAGVAFLKSRLIGVDNRIIQEISSLSCIRLLALHNPG